MAKITAKQSKLARSLLKWNIHDLANHLKNIPARRIESFERGSVQLMEWENTELVRSFKRAGILFKADLEVALEQGGVRHDAEKGLFRIEEGARIVVNADMTVASDTTEQKLPGAEIPPKDEDRRKDDKVKSAQAIDKNTKK